MNKTFYFCLCLFLFVSNVIFGQHQHAATEKPKPAELLQGIGDHHHPVSTKNAEAQKFFDQGFTMIYAFNHDEAIRSFQRAAELDPNLAMAYWGIAYALGPNINLDVDPEREKAAYEAAQKALSIASKATEQERAYIEALVKRYSNDPKADLKKLAVEYKDAMAQLVKRYPDDLDLATLYADALMNLRPWNFWTPDGKPEEGTEEIVFTLESVLRRDPNHVGANHLYIHAVEASLNPERALPSAQRLSGLVPVAGHLVHMPAHIYARTGFYPEAAKANEQAIIADEAYFKKAGSQGVYPLMYYNHNIHFFSYAMSMAGNYAKAMESADRIAKAATPYVKEMPMVEGYVPTPIFIALKFRKWDEILKMPDPGAGLPITRVAWRLARAITFARTGRIAEAEKEQIAFQEARKPVADDLAFGALNTSGGFFRLAEPLLSAELAVAKKDLQTAVTEYTKAVAAEDLLHYDEPPAWFQPVRESLGAALLRSGKAADAEKVFREDLTKNLRNGRSLFGLMESLKAQGKTADAKSVELQWKAAWQAADSQLRIEDL